MIVVKLGGSLLGNPALAHWLKVLVAYQKEALVIVPGGGIFADAVRVAQQKAGVNDATAHQLALLAMDQYGLLLASMQASLVIVKTEREIAQCGDQQRAVVWLPSIMVLADERIPQHWQMTSDSISAWLAEKLGASHLVVVKSAPLDTADLVDAYFADATKARNFKTTLMHANEYTLLEAKLL
jgi:aspartokinase-like uncharacterized kinase